MHVERNHFRAPACVAALAVSLFACDPPKPSPPRILPSATDAGATAAQGASAPVDEKKLLELARTTRDAATKLVKGCSLYERAIVSNLNRFFVEENCTFRDPEVAEFRSALDAFRAPAIDAGGGAARFAVEAGLFADWIELARRTVGRGGTLMHYQDLARTWNAWRKDDVIPVDPVRRSDWMRPKELAADGSLKWDRCANTPCILLKND